MEIPKSVIWDFNGTIMNDADLAASAVSELLRRRNLPEISTAFHRQVFGFPVSEYYRKLGLDLVLEDQSQISDEYHEIYLSGVSSCSVNDGVKGILKWFHTRGITQYVLSAAEQNMLQTWVQMFEIENYFRAVYGLSDRLAKTKEGRGLELIDRFGIEPETALFIGDTDHDVEVANSLGCRCVIIPQGHQDRSRIDGAGLQCEVFNSYSALLAAVSSNGQGNAE